MKNIKLEDDFDENWAIRHKDEIEKINNMAKKLKGNRRIQKIREKFLKSYK